MTLDPVISENELNVDTSGYEYYAIERYALDKDQNQIYAKKNKNQYYLSKNDGTEVMAEKKNDQNMFVPYFAFEEKDKTPICPILTKNQKCLIKNVPYPAINNKERYPKRHKHEYYVDRGQGMKYAKNENLDDYCATNSQGKRYYAFTTTSENEEVEFPPQKKNKENIYIEENNTVIYPLNITKNLPVYAKDKDNNEVYFQKNNVEIYGRNKFHLPIYAKDKDGKDRPALQNNVPYYSFYEKNGIKYQYYPKLKDKTEFYVKEDKKEIYAKFDNEERYAKTKDQDDILATNDEVPYYATDKENVEMYPKNSGDNFYRKEDDIEKIAINKTTKEGFYAKKKNNDEFYPKNFKTLPEEKTIDVIIDAPMEPTEDEITTHIASRD